MKKTMLAFIVLVSLVAFTGCSTVQNGAEKAVDTAQDIAEDLGEDIREESDKVLGGNEDTAEVAADARERSEEILSDLDLTDKAALNITERDSSTVKYELWIMDDDIDTSDSALETRITSAEENFTNSLDALKEKGVENAHVVVEFLSESGRELYQKIYQ